MFSEKILINNLNIDSRISFYGISIDDSMKATLGVLLHQRLQDNIFYIEICERKDVFDFPVNTNKVDESFLMISIGTKPNRELLLTVGFEELVDVELYLNQNDRHVRTHIWVNELKHTAEVYCSSLPPTYFHLLQSVLPRLLPWIFKDKSLSSTEKDLLYSLAKKDSETYKMLLNSLLKNIQKESLGRKLDAFLNNNADMRLKETERSINEIMDNLNELQNSYNAYLTKLAIEEEEKAKLEISLSHSNEALKEQIIEYLKVSPSVEISVEDCKMIVLVKTHLEFFDPEHLKIILSNPKSKVNLCLKSEQIEVLKAIFIEQRFKIPVQAAYKLYADGGVTAVTEGGRQYEVDTLVNPHIGIHGCLGQFFQEISGAIKSNNYIMAIEECVASAKSINISESATFDYIVKDAENNQLLVEDSTGKRYTFNEACELLRKEKANEQANENIN